MIIRSSNGDTVVELLRNDIDDDFSDFTFKVERTDEIQHFVGVSDQLQLLGYEDFLRKAVQFFETREGEVVLEMTEESSLEFFRWSGIGDIGVRATVNVHGFSTNTHRSSRYSLTVDFEIDGEYANTVLEGLQHLEGK